MPRGRLSNVETSPKTIVVIPAYNEGKTVGAVVAGVKPYVSDVIVVDDCSCDDTSAVAAAAGARVLRNETNQNYDGTIDRGFAEAVRRGADIVITFDADGEHEPHDLPKMIEPIASGRADMAIGQRPGTTHFCEKIFAFYTGVRYGIWDPLCGCKAYSRKVYDAVGHFDTVKSIGTELMIMGRKKGFAMELVPITLHNREDTSRFYAQRFRANIKILKAMFRVISLSLKSR